LQRRGQQALGTLLAATLVGVRRRLRGRGSRGARLAPCSLASPGLAPVLAGQETVIAAVEALDPGSSPITAVEEVTPGPGLANRHFRLVRASGDSLLAKVSRGSEETFEAEYAGLRALGAVAESCGLVAPRPHVLGALPDGKGSFLVMDYLKFVPFGPSIPSVLERMGHGLALLHNSAVPSREVVLGSCSWAPAHSAREEGGPYGFYGQQTFLGGTRQCNEPCADYAAFFVEHRLRPQLERACLKFQYRYGTTNEANTAHRRLYERVIQRAAEALEPVRLCPPSLLHGDLWTGNTGATTAREPILVDPACWHGHAEFDLAISRLFGRFDDRFYEAYHEVNPRAPGFEERQQVYVLYHMLNQANLHGAGFGSGGSAEHPGGYLELAIEAMEKLAA